MPHYPGHYKRYGYGETDLSDLENVYERSRVPNYGKEQARQRAALQAEADKLRRTYQLFRMSGMEVSDWSRGLQSQVNQIKPELTQQQMETKNQSKYISDSIRRYKPRNDEQLANVLDAVGAGMEWFSKAKEMAKNYYYGEEVTRYGVNEKTGETEYRVGPERHPDMLATQGKFFKKDVFTTMKTDTNAAMRKDAIAQFHAAGLTGVEEGRAWLKNKQINDTTSGIEWYDKDVMSDFWGMMDKFTAPGQAYTIWYMDKHPQTGKSVIRAKQVHKGRSDEAAIKKIDPNAVGSKDALLAAHGQVNAHSDLVTRVLGMVVEGEGEKVVADSPENMIQAYEAGLQNIISFDPLGDRKKTIEAIYQLPMAELSYKAKVLEHGDKLRKKLSKDQMDILLPQLQEIIRQSDVVGPGDLGLYPGEQEKSVNRWVSTLMQNIEGSGEFTSEAKVAIEEYARSVLTERRTAQKHGLDVEKLQSGLFTENLKQQKIILETGKLLHQQMTFNQANRATRILNEIYDDYRNNSGVFASSVEVSGQPPVSLRTAVETAFVREGIQYSKEDWDALDTKLAEFKKAHAADQDRTLVNLKRRADLEQTKQGMSEVDRKRDIEGLDIGPRYNSHGQPWVHEDGTPRLVETREDEALAIKAGYNQTAPRAYTAIDADYMIYQGKGAGVTVETHPNLIGQQILTKKGSELKQLELQKEIMTHEFYKGQAKIEDNYYSVKHSLEMGAIYGGEFDHAALLKFMRTMDDSIVTEGEVETVERHAGFTDRMRKISATWKRGDTLTPIQRGIIASIMEEIMVGMRRRRLRKADAVLNAWADPETGTYGKKRQPINPVLKDKIAPWYNEWKDGTIELIDIPNKPVRKGGEHTKTEPSGVSAKDVASGVITVIDVTNDRTGEVTKISRDPSEMPVSKTGSFDLSNVPVLQWEDNLKLLLRTLRVSLGPEDPVIKDLQEAIRKVRGSK